MEKRNQYYLRIAGNYMKLSEKCISRIINLTDMRDTLTKKIKITMFSFATISNLNLRLHLVNLLTP